jgi:hypothetical protein
MLKNSKVCFISVTLKSWSGRKLLDNTTYSRHSCDHQQGALQQQQHKQYTNNSIKMYGKIT